MNTKKLALFGGAVVVIAGALVYTLGIYPPASSRDGQGAIGERQVYRAEQPKDASVTPGAAPVAMRANAEIGRKAQIFQLQNGQFIRMRDGSFAVQLATGEMHPLNNALVHELNASELKNDALYSQLKDGMVMQVSADQFVFALRGSQFTAQVRDGMFLQLQSGQFIRLRDGSFAEMNGHLMQLNANQLQSGMKELQ